ncbi:MAG: hypothetical protein JOZ52_08460 [Acidobacteria bacterium]|nr:hypothetical protein [Acidobacteriota bacterium]
MSFKKILLLPALLFLCALSASAQNGKCSLKLAQLKSAPELHGLHVGMSVDQVKGLMPWVEVVRADDLGFSTTSFSPDFNPQIDKAAYAGIRTITLEFLDGKLFTIWVGFNESFKWKTLEEFLPGMSAELGLPTGVWMPDSSKPTIECDDFELTAQMIGQGPSLRLVDKRARDLWEERRAEKEEKRSEKDEP